MDCSRRRGSAEEERCDEREEEQGREGIAGASSDGEGDLSDGDGSASMGMARWLGALEVQTMGACRADERSSLLSLPCLLSLPLLRLSLSLSLSLSLTSSAHPSLGIFGPAAQDRLLAHLTQVRYLWSLLFYFILLYSIHPSITVTAALFLSSSSSSSSSINQTTHVQLFDASEIGLLVRCLCAPLVSIRVGKVNRLGSLLCPIPYRYSFILSFTSSPTSPSFPIPSHHKWFPTVETYKLWRPQFYYF